MPPPPGVTRAAIVIGVDRTGQLQPLAAAAKGAQEMADWFGAEDYHVTSITDANGGKVRIADIFEAVTDALASNSLTTLVIYFAGHGYYSVGSEIWLLSGAPDNPGEAINLGESTVAARGCGLTNVVFIADTCRSIPQTLAANAVRGVSIFPIRQSGAEAQIDTFYATNPGDVAVEVAVDAARTSYDGLFTQVLHSLHGAAPAEDLVTAVRDGQTVSVLPNRRLRRLLPAHFVRHARAIGAVISQTPSLRIESDEPFFVATALPAPAVDARGGDLQLQPFAAGGDAGPDLARAARNLIASARIPEIPLIRNPDQDPGEVRLAGEAREHRAVEREGGFETQSGFLVSGTSVIEASCFGGPWCDIECPGEADNRVRVHTREGDWKPATAPGSAVLRFADGTGSILAVIPGYVASLIVRDGGIISVTYAPAPHSARRADYELSMEEAAERRAIAATAARHGFLAMDRDEARQFADTIRVGKAVDPSLGIYAALAYANVGLSRDAVSVLHAMQDDLGVTLLDVWLLAGADRAARRDLPLVPPCPMLSQAWDYLRPRGWDVPGVLSAAPRHQSLWTTFMADPMDAIFDAARKGELG